MVPTLGWCDSLREISLDEMREGRCELSLDLKDRHQDRFTVRDCQAA